MAAMSAEATGAFARRHPRAFVLVRLASVVVAGLLALEIVVRIATFVSWRRGLSEFPDLRRRHDASRALYPVMNVGALVGDPAGFPAIVPVDDGPPRVVPFGSVDESAFRKPLPQAPPAAQHARIVFVGGSTTYDGYPEVVAERLAERFGAGRVEAVNLGVPASNSATSLVLMRRFLPRLRPHAVVVYHGFNDLAYHRARARAEERQAKGASAVEPAMFVERPSRGLLDLLFARTLDALPAAALDGPTRDYEAMAELARELGFTLYLSTFAAPAYDEIDAPSRRFFEADLRYLWPILAPVDRYRADLSAYNDRVRQVAPRIGARLIDVAAAVHGGRDRFRDNCHTTVEGRGLHAAAVAAALAPSIPALIGQPSPP